MADTTLLWNARIVDGSGGLFDLIQGKKRSGHDRGRQLIP